MKASEARLRAALDRPPADIRLFLLHGPDAASAEGHVDRLRIAMGPDAERVDLEGATLRAEPARLVDEASALSLFGGARWIRVTGVGEESLTAIEATLAMPSAGAPVVMLAPALRTTAKVVKAVIAAPAGLAFACYPPQRAQLERLVAEDASSMGLEPDVGVIARLLHTTGDDRSVISRELEKFATYLDAAPGEPKRFGHEVLDAVAVDMDEAGQEDLVDAIILKDAAATAEVLQALVRSGSSAVPWLRAVSRRLTMLAEMRADIAQGASVQAVVAKHRLSRDREAKTVTAARNWKSSELASAITRSRQAERSLMLYGAAGATIGAQAILDAIAYGKR